MNAAIQGAHRRSLSFLLIALVVLPATTAAPSAVSDGAFPAVPCPDSPQGILRCPDLAVDGRSIGEIFMDDAHFPPTHCAVVEGLVDAGERRLMRFGVATANVGTGDVALGAPQSRLDLFTWSDCHGHYHFNAFAAYRLWTPEGYAAWTAARAAAPGQPAERVLKDNPDIANAHVAGHKVGFCIVDIRPNAPGLSIPIPKQYTSCGDQGLTAGWEDHYSHHLDGQWIDVTGLASGHYVLEVEANPERVIEEATYDNNAAATLVYVWASP